MTQVYNRLSIGSLHDRHLSYEKQQAPYFPVGLQNLGSNSSHKEPGIGKSWNRLQSHSPVSENSHGSRSEGEMYQSRPESAPKGTREQLPSLSSLFGSTPAQSKQAQSPFSDRPSPVFPITSPRDPRHPRHPGTPTYTERSFDGSYFQKPNQQYTFNSRAEHVERTGPPQPPASAQVAVKPESPRYESRFNPVDSSRPQASSSWSPRTQTSRPEYFSRDTSSSFRTQTEHPKSHRPEQETRPHYRDGLHNLPVTPNFPPTPASTAVGEITTSKDGLGPKIWTGTQFLPRFVRQAEVGGEGMCYFYDDGTHCKTVIDGEHVNAHWGVTKAGKPRKRLAIACITCREKKIKCDPDFPRCIQCEKFGRVCKFKNAPRGGQGSPDTPPADPEDVVSRPVSSRADIESFKEGRESIEPVSPQNAVRESPESEIRPPKRQRTSYSHFTPVPSEGSPQPSARETGSPSTSWQEPLSVAPPDHDLVRDWQANPQTIRPALFSELINGFFKHAPETVSFVFPQAAFISWVLSGGEKSLDDLMLIYTILAFGTIFSQSDEHKTLGHRYASIARYASENRKYSIQLVQSRMLLSLYYYAVNNTSDAWEFCGSAARAAIGLRLNVEIEKSEDFKLRTFPYGLSRHGYAECRRRTFWSCYLLDRFNGLCSGQFTMLHPEDIFLRLPCDTNSFEQQLDTQNPFFDATTPPIQNVNWTVGSNAYLINLATIWGEVTANIYRSSQRPVNKSSTFSDFYDTISRRLQAWNSSLPHAFTYSAENLRRAADGGFINIFVTMHTLYHHTTMKLNRYIQGAAVESSQWHAQHVAVANQHAEALLSIADALAAVRSSGPTSPSFLSIVPSRHASPFVGYAIVSAIDILTAKPPLSTIPSLLTSFSGAQSILAELALHWQSAKNQQALILERIRDLAELTAEHNNTAYRFSGEGRSGIFEMKEPIEKTFSSTKDFDRIYA